MAVEELAHAQIGLADDFLVGCVDERVGAAVGLLVEAHDVEQLTKG